jgi:hypothetical protein
MESALFLAVVVIATILTAPLGYVRVAISSERTRR